MKHTHALKPVRSIMRIDRRHDRPIESIKNALFACGHYTGHLSGRKSVSQYLGALPKPQLERVLSNILNAN